MALFESSEGARQQRPIVVIGAKRKGPLQYFYETDIKGVASQKMTCYKAEQVKKAFF